MINPIKLAAIALAGMLAATAAHADGHPTCDADAIKLGAKQFKKCKACHKLDAKNGIGPHLAQLANRPVASVDGFKYSKPMTAFAEGGSVVWDFANFDKFIKKPKKLIKGTKMSFGGIKKDAQRAALFCYLEAEGGGSS
ncbi:MAG: c-type cytochrome [Pseudomonadota bacterium]